MARSLSGSWVWRTGAILPSRRIVWLSEFVQEVEATASPRALPVLLAWLAFYVIAIVGSFVTTS